MTQLIFHNPFPHLSDESNLARSFGNKLLGGQRATSFLVDIRDEETEYCIVADLPGVAKDAISVHVENNVLHIRATAAPQNENLLLGERATGEISRAFRLSRRVDAEKINAVLENGVLTITLPKAADASSRKIAIN